MYSGIFHFALYRPQLSVERAPDLLKWRQLVMTANSLSVTCHLMMSMYFRNLLPVSTFRPTLGYICVVRTRVKNVSGHPCEGCHLMVTFRGHNEDRQ